ncbi:MAG: hypothetical protein Q9202_004447 [Teloschistes flavicans]
MKGYRHAVRDYIVPNTIKAAKEAKEERKRIRKQNIKKGVAAFVRECRQLQEQLHSDRYHLFRDSTFFVYDVCLVRVNIDENNSERFELKLAQTHDAPHYYATLIIHHHPLRLPEATILAPIGSDWTTAFESFTYNFATITGMEWEERLGPKLKEYEELRFIYVAPKEGEPRGVMGDALGF